MFKLKTKERIPNRANKTHIASKLYEDSCSERWGGRRRKNITKMISLEIWKCFQTLFYFLQHLSASSQTEVEISWIFRREESCLAWTKVSTSWTKSAEESMADENASNVGMEREKLQTINFSLNLSHCSTLVSGMGSGVWSSWFELEHSKMLVTKRQICIITGWRGGKKCCMKAVNNPPKDHSSLN